MATSQWARLLPEFADAEERARARAVLAACGGMIAACAALLCTWLLSGDLEGITVIAAGIFVAILIGIAALARRGRVTLSGWLLTGLLATLITADAWSYGLGSPAATAYIIPIVLAISALGAKAGWGLATASSLSVMLLAWGEVAGWHTPLSPVEVSHLTFNAPLLSVVFLLTAAILNARLRSPQPHTA